jgi:probable F420-dependent oxidoreductase
MQPFRFSIHTGALDPETDVVALGRRAEDLGYHALYVTDHLGRRRSPLAVLGALAVATSRIRIGGYVFANDFRHPLLLAGEAASLDVLSNGRLDLGLGAGWKAADYRQLGMPYDAPGRRIDRLEEALGIILRLLNGEEVTHAGDAYRLDRARIGPLPVQRPHPRLMLGGGGPRLLALAGRTADIVSFAPRMSTAGRPMLRSATDGSLREKVAVVRRAAGDRFADLELNAFVGDAGIVGTPSPAGSSVATLVKSAGPALVGGSPHVLYGTLAGLRDGLLHRRERTGLSSYSLPAHAVDAFAPLVEALAER